MTFIIYWSNCFVIIYMIDADTFSKHRNLELIEIAWTTLYTDWCISFFRLLKHQLCCVFVFMHVCYVSSIQLRLKVIYIFYVYLCHSLILRTWLFFVQNMKYISICLIIYLSIILSQSVSYFYICGHLVI